MAQETLLQKLEKAARLRQLEKFSSESLDWFRREALKIGSAKARREFLMSRKKTKNINTSAAIGSFFVFMYDAKYKDELPYFDRYPLIIFLGPTKHNGVVAGLNIHYIPPKARAILFQNLLDLANNTKYDEKTKLKISYSILQSTQKYAAFKPCYKHYRLDHITSAPVKIPFDQIESVLFLPIAQWSNNVANTKVWSDSIQKI